MNPIDLLGAGVGWLSSEVASAAGWAWDTVVNGITDWIIKAVVKMILLIWQVISKTTTPHVDAEWFSGRAGSPWWMAFQLGLAVMLILLFAAIVRGVLAASAGMIVRSLFHDLPMAVITMGSLLVVVQALIGLCDQISDWVWQSAAASAPERLDGLAKVLMVLDAPTGGLLTGVFAALLGASMLFVWIVLAIRDSLIYIVVVYAGLLGIPSMVHPTLRPMSRKVAEAIFALIISKPLIVFAIAIGINALEGVGATAAPGSGTIDSFFAEAGTLMIAIITFMIASFMPFLVLKLLPHAEAAAIGHGVAGGPARAAGQASQMSRMHNQVISRLSTNNPSAPASPMAGGAQSAAGTNTTASTTAMSSTSSMGSASMAGSGSGAGAAAASGPGAPVAAAATAATAVGATVTAATGPAGPSGPAGVLGDQGRAGTTGESGRDGRANDDRRQGAPRPGVDRSGTGAAS